MKAALYLNTGTEIKLLETHNSLADAMLSSKITPCPYGAKLFVIDEKFNIITGGNVLSIHDRKTDTLITREYCETKGLAEFTAGVLRKMGYRIYVD